MPDLRLTLTLTHIKQDHRLPLIPQLFSIAR